MNSPSGPEQEPEPITSVRIYNGDAIRRKTLIKIGLYRRFAPEPKVVGSTPASRTSFFPLKNLNEFGVIRFFNRLGYVVGIWVKPPSKPEQKPEQRRGTERNGVLERLAWGFDENLTSSWKKTCPDRLA